MDGTERMTIEEIERQAIEAAIKECRRCLVKDCGQLEDAIPLAIKAYEAELWQDAKNADMDMTYLVKGEKGQLAIAQLHEDGWIHEVSGAPTYRPIWQGLYFTPTHFRPLPALGGGR